MKYIVLITVFAFASASAVDYYKLNDDINLDAVVSNPITLQSYMDCFSDKGPCSELNLSYKEILQESIEQACARCTDKMKYLYYRFITGIKELFPEQFDGYIHHFDPENKYKDALIKEISKYTKPPK